jgi:hypothetical protein
MRLSQAWWSPFEPDSGSTVAVLHCSTGSLAPKASAGRVRSCVLDGSAALMRWRGLRAMAAVEGRCYTAATWILATLARHRLTSGLCGAGARNPLWYWSSAV